MPIKELEDSVAEARTEKEIVEYEHARLEFDGPLATFVLNDPDKLNALRPDMIEALYAALIEISKPRRKTRCLLLRGEGRAFCAGANLALGAASQTSARKEPPVIQSVSGTYHPLVRRLRDLEIPVVTAVQGPCVGFGVALALLSDYLIASEDAYFYIPFAGIASAPDSGLTWFLANAIGTPRARQMIMRAERLPAGKALEWGMINQLCSEADFAEETARIADEFANGPTIALGIIRQLFQRGPSNTLDEQLEAEARGVMRTCRTKDNSAAMRAFGSKSRPEFTGE